MFTHAPNSSSIQHGWLLFPFMQILQKQRLWLAKLSTSSPVSCDQWRRGTWDEHGSSRFHPFQQGAWDASNTSGVVRSGIPRPDPIASVLSVFFSCSPSHVAHSQIACHHLLLASFCFWSITGFLVLLSKNELSSNMSPRQRHEIYFASEETFLGSLWSLRIY